MTVKEMEVLDLVTEIFGNGINRVFVLGRMLSERNLESWWYFFAEARRLCEDYEK